MLEQPITDGCSADEAGEGVIEQVQQLGKELLGQWARGANYNPDSWTNPLAGQKSRRRAVFERASPAPLNN
jgi:hypothetical protein